MLNAEIICISNRLLTPFFPDTNTLWLTEKLNDLGLEVKQKIIISSAPPLLADILKATVNRCQMLIILIDIKEYSVVQEFCEKCLSDLLVLTKEFLPLSNASNINQLESLETPLSDLEQVENHIKGLLCSAEGKRIVILPNELSDIKLMFNMAFSSLKEFAPAIHLRRRILKVVGMSESAIDSQIAPIYSQYKQLTTMILFFQNEVHIRLALSANSEVEAEEILEEVVSKISSQLGRNLFTQTGETLEEVVTTGLSKKNFTVAVADNATGGLFAMRFTNSPEGENCLSMANIRFYPVETPIELMGRDGNISTISDPISQAGAIALAIDAQKLSGATIGLGITGIVDKELATAQHPLGLVYIALADENKTAFQRLHLPARDREILRGLTSAIALDLLRRKYC